MYMFFLSLCALVTVYKFSGIMNLLNVTNPFMVINSGVVGWCEGAVYLTSLGRPTDIGLQLGKACYPCSG